MMTVLGVDPGVRGGMALIDLTSYFKIVTIKFAPNDTETEVINKIVSLTFFVIGPRICFMEKVGYMPTDGGQGAFTFGKIYGLLRGALLAYNFTIYDVTPMIWQSKMECLTGGNKNVSKRRAQELFPSIKVTHAIADALLIAEYGRRQLDQSRA